MSGRILKLNSTGELNILISGSQYEREIILFKISPICTVSFVAERVFDNWFSRLDHSEKIICAKIDVISARSVSWRISEIYGIKHESPQIIWLDNNGTVRWHASHHLISEPALNEQLNAGKK